MSNVNQNSSSEIILVDENDKAIGLKEKLLAHQLGLLHRAFSVFVFRYNDQSKLELLLQKRNINKYHSGGLWSNTCCGHPWTDDIKDDAKQRLFEETGIRINELKKVGVFRYKADLGESLFENEIDHLFIGYHTGDKFDVNVDEISDIKWLDLDQINLELQKAPECFTAWFIGISQSYDLWNKLWQQSSL